MFRTLTLLGSTGSIGRQALQVAARFPGRLRVAALSAGSNAELLAKQALEFQPEVVHIGRADLEGELRAALGPGFRGEVLAGPQHLARVAAETPADLVLVATVGFTGLGPTLAALAAGRHIALANKEVLVCGGHLVIPLARAKGLHVLPVDSEHNAIFQCLACGPVEALRRVVLTCSGGSFRNADAATIDTAGPAQTLRHPTWTMGSKITVDSATLMNKGFEVIEAHHLFDLPLDKIEVVIHPQSVIHSMVEYIDGSMIAQLGRTDMRLPIQNILLYPERLATDLPPISLSELARLDFSEPDHERFPALRMAYEASAAGGSLPCALNAANEIAVAAHLDGAIPCGGIPRLLRAALDTWRDRPVDTLESLCDADREARELARGLLGAGV
ncbi:MAG: 1-deoxy-D-xylulose-5-phosphate reductoisomerase [Candidatus Sumerlaeia bacterium]|nr:1-deoxy-D-xylulose-5-phosphate reductoisomerase [Candidatus Sumerlaeia bacterium]